MNFIPLSEGWLNIVTLKIGNLKSKCRLYNYKGIETTVKRPEIFSGRYVN